MEIFTLNTQLFPEDANVWDSLGNGYVHKGDKKNALKYYQKALSIDPNLPSAISALKELNK